MTTWTNERVSTLKQLWAGGGSGSEIGAVLGVSRNAVLGMLHRLKQPKPEGHRYAYRGPYSPRVKPPQGRKPGSKAKGSRPGPKPPPKPTLCCTLIELAPLRALPAVAAAFETKPLGEPATLMERHEAGCCRPINNGKPFVYCNQHRIADQPYCPSCHGLMYTVRTR